MELPTPCTSLGVPPDHFRLTSGDPSQYQAYLHTIPSFTILS